MHWKKNLLLVWLAQFLGVSGFSFALPFIPFYIKELGITDPAACNLWVAVFAASGYLSLLLFAPVWGFLADLYGRRLMILRAYFVSGLIVPLMGYVPNVFCLVALRFVLGAFAGTVTASQTLVSSNTPVGNRGFALGTLSSAVYGGTMAGAFLGGIVVDRFGYRVAFWVCGIAVILAGLLVLFGVKENFLSSATLRSRIATMTGRPPDFGAAWLLLLLILLIGFSIRFDQPFMPLLVEAVQGPDNAATWTGIIASLSAVAGVVSGCLLGYLADRYPPPRVAAWSALLAGLLMLPQGLAGSLSVLIGARLGMVFFAGGLDPIFQIWLSKCTPDDQRGVFLGWATSAKALGWLLCSLTSGGVAVLLGVRWVYFVAAGIFLSLIPIIRIAGMRVHAQEPTAPCSGARRPGHHGFGTPVRDRSNGTNPIRP
jgi:DHA1 family multidrug resistance protein-like MFS transporter